MFSRFLQTSDLASPALFEAYSSKVNSNSSSNPEMSTSTELPPSPNFTIFPKEIIKSENDNRAYRYLTLGNNLSVILVSDPETEKSAACCDVNVGSLLDPKEGQGLAHFLEHMLFMGTETYPEENAYTAYLNAHGGSSNAYTDDENTVYYFDIQNGFFNEALNLFASFFICPLFSESGVMREINAVDSENSKNLQVKKKNNLPKLIFPLIPFLTSPSSSPSLPSPLLSLFLSLSLSFSPLLSSLTVGFLEKISII